MEDRKVEAIGGGPNNNDGGVQIDIVTITVFKGDELIDEYQFEVATSTSSDDKDMYVSYIDDIEDEFTEHFGILTGDVFMDDSELQEFLCQNDPQCEGESIEIDDYTITITDFSHNGGEEHGFLDVLIDGEEYQFDVFQDATGVGVSTSIEWGSDDDEERANENGVTLDDELMDLISVLYEDWCNEHRM